MGPGVGPPEGLCLMARSTVLNLASLVDLTPEIKSYEIKLAPALTLAGTVSDIDEKPIAGAKVGLSLHRRNWSCGTPVEPVVTDKKGRYEFRALPQQEEYFNYANAEGYFEGIITSGISNVIKERDDFGQIILKKPNLSVSGVVVDASGKPVANIDVGISTAGQPQRQTKTDSQGRFSLDKICAGDIEIWAKLGNFLYGTVEAQAGQKDIKVVVSPIK